MKILALGGAVAPLLFTAVVLLCGALRPGYSHIRQLLSELGETGAPHAALMNFAGFVPSGLLLVAFGVSLGARLPRSRASVTGATLIALFGAGIVAAGVLSCDPGCPRRAISPEAAAHRMVSIGAFASGISSLAVWSLCFRRLSAWRPLWLYSALSSAVALAFLLATYATFDSRAFTGAWQRLSLGTLYAWCLVTGARVYRLGSRREERAV